MGIDIYMWWEGQTDSERREQFTGFSAVHGHVGYLREAYHGGPYVTEYLVKEAFEDSDHDHGPEIPAAVLRERLPKALELAVDRQAAVYGRQVSYDDPEIKAFREFVDLAERKEKETGKPVRIHASY